MPTVEGYAQNIKATSTPVKIRALSDLAIPEPVRASQLGGQEVDKCPHPRSYVLPVRINRM